MRTFGACCAVLAGANVVNNVVGPRWAPLTSGVATAALLGIARRAGLTPSEIGFEKAVAGAAIGGTLMGGVAAVYVGGVAAPGTRGLFLDERALALTRGRLFEEALLQVPVGTVLLEEVGFRGVLPAVLARSMRPRGAEAVCAALFGLWHVLPALDLAKANPALGGTSAVKVVAGTVASTAAAGLLFHELRRRGGLLAPALLHVATNSFGFAAARTARRLNARRAAGARGAGVVPDPVAGGQCPDG